MAKDVYKKLAKHLDSLPGGFPPSPSGVELKILKKLFTPDEAEFATKLSLIPELPPVIARRAGMSVAEAAAKLEDMAKKGLIFRYERKGQAFYMAAQYVIGIWEYNVNNLDEELIRLMNEYLPTLFDHDAWKKGAQLRTIPIAKSITPEHHVMPHEQAEALVEGHRKFLVAPCICRREHTMVGEGCDKPEESCLVFGPGVDFYEKNGLGRRITKEEALEIINTAAKKGLVLQPSNAQKPVNICCCCGCCCQVLKSMKRHPRPAELVHTPFVAKADREACTGCGVCLDRCQMEALTLDGPVKEGRVVLNADRCIGCGLCVPTCPGKALSLERKPEAEVPEVPGNMIEMAMQSGRARGKLSPMSLAMTGLRSKVDRLLASKS